MVAKEERLVRYSGHAYLRQRLVFSVLSRRPVRIDSIRSKDVTPGLRDYEVKFLRLLEALTNGTVIEISYTGTTVYMRPGQLHGGPITMVCDAHRPLGYYIEGVLPLLPWCKHTARLSLHGITLGGPSDSSVDLVRTALLAPLKDQLGLGDELELRILKRGAPRADGAGKGPLGEVLLVCPVVKNTMPTLHWLSPGRIQRIRGIASATRVSPAMAGRLVEAARGVLNRYIPDIYIYTDVRHGDEAGGAPAWALTLVAESNTGCVAAAERTGGAGLVPEDIARECARALLVAVEAGGCVDASQMRMLLTSMVLSSPDVGRVRVGSALFTPAIVQFLRDLRTFFGTEFHVQEDEASAGKEAIMSCVGIGYSNANRIVN